jgi:hypothetical protein
MIRHFALAFAILIPQAAAAQTAVWQVTTPPPLTLLRDRAAQLQVSVLDRPVSHPRIVNSTLREPSTGALLTSEWLSLCERSGDRCAAPAALAKGPHGMFIVVSDGFNGRGEFKGTIYLQVDERPEPVAVEFTVLGSSYGAWIAGWFALLAGVLLSIGSTIILKQWSLRLDALAPAALLAQRLDDDEQVLADASRTTGFEFPELRKKCAALRRDLSETTLDLKNFLPKRLGNPLGGDAASEAYKTYLVEKGDAVGVLAAIVSQGVPPIVDAWKSQPKHAAVKTALTDLDMLASKPLKPAEVSDQVARVVATMEAGLAPPNAMGAPQPAGAPPAATRSIVEIRSQQGRLALVAWGTWAVVTLLAGAAALIVINNAFGVPLDYFKCFFWGLGIQSAGQQLQTLTPGGIASSFKLSLPKGRRRVSIRRRVPARMVLRPER